MFRQLDRARSRVAGARTTADAIDADTVALRLAGPARGLLTGERTALNFLQTLSATATATRALVDALAGTTTRMLDTRKTLPGLRLAQKYAVRCGGGAEPPLGLYDAILIKENHIAAAGVDRGRDQRRARASPRGVPLEVEVENARGARAKRSVRDADSIMLDEFTLADMRARRAAAQRAARHAQGARGLGRRRRWTALARDRPRPASTSSPSARSPSTSRADRSLDALRLRAPASGSCQPDSRARYAAAWISRCGWAIAVALRVVDAEAASASG